jgi:hypothetical protein
LRWKSQGFTHGAGQPCVACSCINGRGDGHNETEHDSLLKVRLAMDSTLAWNAKLSC